MAVISNMGGRLNDAISAEPLDGVEGYIAPTLDKLGLSTHKKSGQYGWLSLFAGMMPGVGSMAQNVGSVFFSSMGNVEALNESLKALLEDEYVQELLDRAGKPHTVRGLTEKLEENPGLHEALRRMKAEAADPTQIGVQVAAGALAAAPFTGFISSTVAMLGGSMLADHLYEANVKEHVLNVVATSAAMSQYFRDGGDPRDPALQLLALATQKPQEMQALGAALYREGADIATLLEEHRDALAHGHAHESPLARLLDDVAASHPPVDFACGKQENEPMECYTARLGIHPLELMFSDAEELVLTAERSPQAQARLAAEALRQQGVTADADIPPGGYATPLAHHPQPIRDDEPVLQQGA